MAIAGATGHPSHFRRGGLARSPDSQFGNASARVCPSSATTALIRDKERTNEEVRIAGNSPRLFVLFGLLIVAGIAILLVLTIGGGFKHPNMSSSPPQPLFLYCVDRGDYGIVRRRRLVLLH